VQPTSVHVVDSLTATEREVIVDGLVDFNAARGFVWASWELAVVARDTDGMLVGGLLGHTNVGWLFVAALWVLESERRRGLGRALMEAAEREASRRGCVGVYLDTYSFQARPFYEGLGYQVFGTLPDCPPGATKFYLSKRLACAGAPAI
jgi:GNAT superfamily N-acetyltransferase